MTTINLADPTIYVNNVNNPTDGEKLRTDLNTIITEENAKDTRLGNLESGIMSISGVKTFTSIPILPASNPSTANEAARKAYVDAAAVGTNGLLVEYASASTLTINKGSCRDNTGAYIFTISSPLTLDITTTGINGRDSGVEASNTTYFVYLIGKTDGTVASTLSTTNEFISGAITLPVGYTLKRQLPLWVRNDGSSNFIPFYLEGWGSYLTYWYKVTTTYFYAGYGLGTTNVLNAGTATSFTAMTSMSNFIPNGFSDMAWLETSSSSSGDFFVLRDSLGSGIQQQCNSNSKTGLYVLNSSQQLEYIRTSGTGALYVDVKGVLINRRGLLVPTP